MDEDEIRREDEAIAWEATADTATYDADVYTIIHFILERYKRVED